jgi:hypothetical protein
MRLPPWDLRDIIYDLSYSFMGVRDFAGFEADFDSFYSARANESASKRTLTHGLRGA